MQGEETYSLAGYLLRVFGHFGQGGQRVRCRVALRGVAQCDGHVLAVGVHADHGDAGFAQGAPCIFYKLALPLLAQVVAVDLQHQMRAAAQFQPQRDLVARQEGRETFQHRGGQQIGQCE